MITGGTPLKDSGGGDNGPPNGDSPFEGPPLGALDVVTDGTPIKNDGDNDGLADEAPIGG